MGTKTAEELAGLAIYHERQSLELCLLHALNNFFQRKEFTKTDLDEAASALAPETRWLNPHRSWFGTGNYDINVLIAVLSTRDLVPKWFDRRKKVESLNLANIRGFILNIPSSPSIGGLVTLPFLKRRHWISLVEVGGGWHNLDSKLPSPKLIGDAADVLAFLRSAQESGDREIFAVVTPDVDEAHNWATSP